MADLPALAPLELLKHNVRSKVQMGYTVQEVMEIFQVAIDFVEDALGVGPNSGRITQSLAKALELARLDALAKTYLPKALEGQIGASKHVLEIMERRAKYLGLDSAARTEGTLKIEVPWLSPSRLSYKNEGEVIENVTDITPLIEAKRILTAAEDQEPPRP